MNLHSACSSAAVSVSFALHPIHLNAKRKRFQTPLPKLRRNADDGGATLSYPKSSPTPLLIRKASTPAAGEDPVDRILLDLQSAVAGGVRLDPSTFSSFLELLFRAGDPSPRRAAAIHRLIPASLLRSSAAISSKLLRLYASCGLVHQAHQLFDKMPHSHKTAAFPWNALIAGYADVGLHEEAMAIYHQMEEEAVEPDRFTFPRVIKACAGIGSLPIAEAIHRDLVRCGFAADPFVLNALIHMYAKCGDIARSRRIFDQITDRDPISWNSMINGYVRHGLFPEAGDICRRMIVSGLDPDAVTVSTLLAGCCAPSKRRFGIEIHAWIFRHGLEGEVSAANSLITMYSEHGELARAQRIFNAMPEKDLVSWNAIISANRRSRRALGLYRLMEDSGTPPDSITFVLLLSACANLGLVGEGRKVFDEMQSRHGIKPAMEHYGCMTNLLGRAGLVDEAMDLVTGIMPFDGGHAVWGSLLHACAVQGNVGIGEKAADQLFDLEPDNEHNFSLLRKIYSDGGRMEDADKVEKLARDRGLEFKQ
ncbi:Pentatricopeptide repeat-containing protein [Platanthera zijinensis]|uniref:Pentatricopeptide repeat-containing protein n=1 Tax=Platanthera zijinensis TaxID=2320716 RepID=A0AAP0G8S6_9ASPA